jgi:hypothetical protein
MRLAFDEPSGVLCHVTDPAGRPTLAGSIRVPDIHAAGQLDRDSEAARPRVRGVARGRSLNGGIIGESRDHG